MKLAVSFFSLLLSIVPFSFWKMDGPYFLNIDENGNLLSYSPLTQAPPQTEEFIKFFGRRTSCSLPPWDDSRTLYFYLYHPHTGYSIGYVSKPKEELDYIRDFLRADFCPMFTFGLPYMDFYFCKEQPGVLQTGITKPTVGAKLHFLLKNDKMKSYSALKHHFCELESEFKGKNLSQDDLNNALNYLRKKKNIPTMQFNPITPQKIFTTQSGVEIMNGYNKVEIKKGEEVIEFTKALTDYYNYDYSDLADLAGELKGGPTSKTLEKFRAIPSIGKHELQRLKKSTILAVYAVIKDDDKGCIIWGAARDNTIKGGGFEKQYHWITKLDCDISFLFSKHIKRTH